MFHWYLKLKAMLHQYLSDRRKRKIAEAFHQGEEYARNFLSKNPSDADLSFLEQQAMSSSVFREGEVARAFDHGVLEELYRVVDDPKPSN